ncbi:stage V sporulation protein AB [Lutibacter sp. B2]|nr:stage V sporulation protein AB [Lutibacter sp. B2]
MIFKLGAAFVGFSEGIIVGTALIAFLTILDIVPRLAQITNTALYSKFYEVVIACSATLVAMFDILSVQSNVGRFVVVIVGILMGLYVGLLASALTEVTNVLPVIVQRFRLEGYAKYVFTVLICGKVVGSLIYWIFMNK